MALLHGFGGRLTTLCGCFRPGQLGRDIHDTAGRPHYMKDGHGCLIDGEFMVLAGGFQCPDEHVATSPCSNLALAYAIHNDAWSTVPSPPWHTGRTQGACTGSSLILVGGQGTPSGQPTATTPPFFNVIALSRGVDGRWAWQLLPQLPAGVRVESAAAGRHSHVVYTLSDGRGPSSPVPTPVGDPAGTGRSIMKYYHFVMNSRRSVQWVCK